MSTLFQGFFTSYYDTNDAQGWNNDYFITQFDTNVASVWIGNLQSSSSIFLNVPDPDPSIAVPTGSTINGVSVDFWDLEDLLGSQSFRIDIEIGNENLGSFVDRFWIVGISNFPGYYNFGGDGDLWSNPGVIQAPGFFDSSFYVGFKLTRQGYGGDTITLDAVGYSIYYTPPPDSGIGHRGRGRQRGIYHF